LKGFIFRSNAGPRQLLQFTCFYGYKSTKTNLLVLPNYPGQKKNASCILSTGTTGGQFLNRHSCFRIVWYKQHESLVPLGRGERLLQTTYQQVDEIDDAESNAALSARELMESSSTPQTMRCKNTCEQASNMCTIPYPSFCRTESAEMYSFFSKLGVHPCSDISKSPSACEIPESVAILRTTNKIIGTTRSGKIVGSRPKLCSPITVTPHSPVSNEMPKTYTPRSRSPGAPRIMKKVKRAASVHPDEAPRSRKSTASSTRDDSNAVSAGGESTL
jgi:hypothetical protein